MGRIALALGFFFHVGSEWMMDQDGCIGVFLLCRYNLALEYRNTTTILRKFDAFSVGLASLFDNHLLYNVVQPRT